MDKQTYTQLNPENSSVDAVQHNLSNIMPTSAEISHLWSSYLAESMSVTFLKHMVAKSKDPDFHGVLQFALDISSKRLNLMEDLFISIQHPIPEAFGEKDVDIKVQELFQEGFLVRYTKLTTKFVLLNYSFAYSDCTRQDFRDLFSGFIDTAKEVISIADNALIAKGLFPKPPTIPFSEKVNYVHDKKYFGSILNNKRSLNAIEITNVFTLMDYLRMMRALTLGFAQVMKTEKMQDHLNRGLQIIDKQLNILGSFLENANLPIPENIDYQVTESKDSPYSEKLLMVHITVVLGYMILSYGRGLTNTSRIDIILSFGRLMTEIGKYIEDGLNLIAENSWLERVPEAANRQELTH